MNNKQEELMNSLQLLKGCKEDYNSILESSQDVDHVLMGGATHGTHEFYSIRIEITKRLIIEQNFNAIAIEGDWPDAYRINRYIKGDKTIKSALDALSGFQRFPNWMWRNKVVVSFIEWLHQYNSNLPLNKKVGFYGLDLYSLNSSIEIIIKYLEKKDIEAAKRAKQRYACFAGFKEDLQSYGYAEILGITKSCEDEVIEQLVEFSYDSCKYMKNENYDDKELFHIKQNIRLVKNAENYYRSMFNINSSSWNIRDRHMVETLDELTQYLDKKLGRSKIITWAHNSHIGDARATEVRIQGQLNIGQLTREKYGNKVLLIGFLTYEGLVTASSKWDGATEYKSICPANIYSYEYLFHHLNIPNFLLNFRVNNDLKKLIPSEALERLIGVIYLPETERHNHYLYVSLAKQFDSVIYIDKTTAVQPLDINDSWNEGEVFETFPSGL